MSEVLDSMFGMFNQKTDDIKTEKDKEQDNRGLFKINPDDAQDKVWRGFVKLLPNIYDTSNPFVRKTEYWITDPRDNTGFLFPSRKTIGKYEKCLAYTTYWKWVNSGDARLEKLAKSIFQYNKRAFLVIQVIKDIQNPENDGKMFVWNCPVAVQQKIEAKLHPSKEDIDMGAEPENVFNPMGSSLLKFRVGWKDGGGDVKFRNWDGVEWETGKKAPMLVNLAKEGEEPNWKPANNLGFKDEKQAQKTIIKYLMGSANLKDFEFTPPTEEQEKRLAGIISFVETGKVEIPQEKIKIKEDRDDNDTNDAKTNTLTEKDDSNNQDESTFDDILNDF